MKDIKLNKDKQLMNRADFIKLNPLILEIYQDKDDGPALVSAIYMAITQKLDIVSFVGNLNTKRIIKPSILLDKEFQRLFMAYFTRKGNHIHFAYPLPLCHLRDSTLFLLQDANELRAIFGAILKKDPDLLVRIIKWTIGVDDMDLLAELGLCDEKKRFLEEAHEFVKAQIEIQESEIRIHPTTPFIPK